MAAEHHKPFFLFRPGFILLCLYVAAYAWLRSAEQIVMQSVALPSVRGTDVFRMIGPNPDMPHWRQQTWRAVFSLPMVVEEESRRHENTARKLYEEALGVASRSRPPAGEQAEQAIDRISLRPPPSPQEQAWQREQARQREIQEMRQEQQQRPVSRQPQPQQQLHPRLNEGDRFFARFVLGESDFRRQCVNIVEKSGRSTAQNGLKSDPNGIQQQALGSV